MPRRAHLFVILLLFAGAVAFRLPKLDTRPLHNDEAVNAIKAAELWQDGRYRYDPDEYHGPTLHYATAPFLSLSGASNRNEVQDKSLRYATVFFGAALVLILLLFVDGLGRHAMSWAALFVAISPAMVFYSRYFIHEMLLVFFTALTIGAGWRYFRRPSRIWAVTSGVGLGLMFATKETFVLSVAAMGIALIATVWLELKNRGEHTSKFLRVRTALSSVNWNHVLLFVASTVVIWFLFFTSFLANFRGPVDSVLTYFPWLKRAAGHSPHLHPWYFYFQRLGWFQPLKGPIWSEALILILTTVGAVFSFRCKNHTLLRFLAIYSIVLAAIYSAISYKTPWCLLNFYFGFILLAGVGAAYLVELSGKRIVRAAVFLFLLGASIQLTAQSWRASHTYSSDRGNPYVYAQTVPDILNLVQRAEGIARVSPSGFKTVVKVISPDSDYWPLPWYLRRFQHVGWYDQIPEDPFAPVVIVSSSFDARLDDRSERKWIMAGITELRPTKFLELYVELELWKKYVESLPPEPDE